MLMSLMEMMAFMQIMSLMLMLAEVVHQILQTLFCSPRGAIPPLL